MRSDTAPMSASNHASSGANGSRYATSGIMRSTLPTGSCRMSAPTRVADLAKASCASGEECIWWVWTARDLTPSRTRALRRQYSISAGLCAKYAFIAAGS